MTSVRLAQGTAGIGLSTVYTVPVGSTAIIKAITLCNKTIQSVAITMTFAGTYVLYSHGITNYDTLTIPFIDQVLQAGEVIQVSANFAGSIDFYISGKVG